MPCAISVLLVDDHALLRKSLHWMLEDDPELAVIGEASNGAEAVELTAIFAAPDMVPREISRTVEIALPEGRAGTSAQRTPTEHASDESVLVPAADITAFPYPVPDHRV